MMTPKALRKMAAGLTYPANQEFDPVTLEPLGVTKERVKLIERNMPELLAGGESLLDIGSNKGFVSLLCRDLYREIDGYEVGVDAYNISEAVRQYHGFDNVRFINKTFRQIPIGKCTTPTYVDGKYIPPDGHGPYDVVYAGSVHHHLFKNAMLHGAPPVLPLKKLVALTGKFLILDGPFSIEGDTSLPVWAKQYKWTTAVTGSYTLQNHIRWLAPQFEPVRDPISNERGRHTMVFKRVKPDIRHKEMTVQDITEIRKRGSSVAANKAREDESVIRVGARRYKFDRGLQSDGVLMVLNSLPNWFAHTELVLTQNGNRIGDVAKWVHGIPMGDPREIKEYWLRLNNILASIGLVEIHFKTGDFILGDADNWIDVDVDMVNDVDRIAGAVSYLGKWKRPGTGAVRAFGRELAGWIADNLQDEFVFQEALKRLLKP